VHDLVVAEGQHEVLGEGVEQAEGELVVVVVPVDRVLLHVGQGVVHPAHVPLHAEAQAAEVGRPRHLRPGGRLLGDHQRAGVLLVGDRVELAQELDRLEVLVAAVLVRDPLAVLARSSPDTASRPRRPRAGRRCGTRRASRARWRAGSWHLVAPKLKIRVPQSGCSPWRGSACS
jgi:hypothetical protein